MVTRSHPGNGDRPLDGRPNPSERRCSARSAAGWRANRGRYDADKTLAALRRPPEDAVGLANNETTERCGLLETTASRAAYVRAWKSRSAPVESSVTSAASG
jgi:hypothetical protein